jgi:hypothetical protein
MDSTPLHEKYKLDLPRNYVKVPENLFKWWNAEDDDFKRAEREHNKQLRRCMEDPLLERKVELSLNKLLKDYSKHKKLRTAVYWYYRVVGLTRNGAFPKKEANKILAELTDCSVTYSRRMNELLVEFGFAHYMGEHKFIINGYHSVWDAMHVSHKTPKKVPYNPKTRKKAYKRKVKSKGILEENVKKIKRIPRHFYGEGRKNLEKVVEEEGGWNITEQKRVELLKIKITLSLIKKTTSLKKAIIEEAVRIQQNRTVRSSESGRRKNEVDATIFATLSGQWAARLIGTRAPSTGCRLRNQLSDEQVLEIKKNEVIVKEGIPYKQALELYQFHTQEPDENGWFYRYEKRNQRIIAVKCSSICVREYRPYSHKSQSQYSSFLEEEKKSRLDFKKSQCFLTNVKDTMLFN